jgi:hypothetical protein
VNLRERLFGDHDDDLTPCGELDFTVDPTTDDLLPWVVLFASVLGNPPAIAKRAREWRELFGGSHA